MRGLLRALRDQAVMGASISEALQTVVPRGLLSGWQYAAALFVGLAVTGNYGAGDRRRSSGRLLAGTALATALPLWMTIWTLGFEVVALKFAIVTVLVWTGLLIERRIVDRFVSLKPNAEQDASPTIFVGSALDCRTAMRHPPFDHSREFQAVGFIDTGSVPDPEALGSIDLFGTLLAQHHAETIVLCGRLQDEQLAAVVELGLAAGCHVVSLARSLELTGATPTVVRRQGQLFVELVRPSLKGWQLTLKRLVDILGASLGLLLLSPVFLLVAIAVRLESPGPVFFRQRRLGRNGLMFRCIKFRSMHKDAEERLKSDLRLYAEYKANSYKLPEETDPRLTRVGRFLRKTSLDEIPQLINVLKGEMSLVGPRPIVPAELAQYEQDGAAIFLSIKPGMTGAWQVSGRSAVGYPDRADMELEYIRNWSLAGDTGILLRTFPAVLARRGAH